MSTTQAGLKLQDLPLMAEEDLLQMGVKTMGSRKRIVAAIWELSEGPTAPAIDKLRTNNTSETSRQSGRTITDFFLSNQASSRKHCITDFFNAAPGSKPAKQCRPTCSGKENRVGQPVKPTRSAF